MKQLKIKPIKLTNIKGIEFNSLCTILSGYQQHIKLTIEVS